MITCVHHHPGPLKSKRSNTVQIRNIAVFKNEFGIILDTSGYGDREVDQNNYPFTYAGIRQWVEDNYGVRISNSAITVVKNKCNVPQIDFKAGKEPAADIIRTEREKLVLEAFKALGIV